jgi:hypothetical protein
MSVEGGREREKEREREEEEEEKEDSNCVAKLSLLMDGHSRH